MKLNPEKYFHGSLLLLVEAVLRHNINEIKYQIDKGVDINSTGNEGMTPIIFSVLNQDEEGIRLLVQNGADPLMLVPNTGSALLIACRTEDTTALKTLIHAGVDINTKINKEPLTFVAARADNLPAIQILIQKGIHVDARDGSGNTLLIESIVVNDIDLADWLIQRHANVHVINVFLISAAFKIQSRFNETFGKGPNETRYRKLKRMFEMRGVNFPVPTPFELEKKLKKNSLTIEEAEQINELGEIVI